MNRREFKEGEALYNRIGTIRAQVFDFVPRRRFLGLVGICAALAAMLVLLPTPGLSLQGADELSLLLVNDSGTSYSAGVGECFEEALDAMGLRYEVYDTLEVGTTPTVSVLAGYDAVIWATGDRFLVIRGKAAETIERYLDGGGALLLCSTWFAFWRSDDLMSDYLHIAYDHQRSTPYLLEGVAADPITSGMQLTIESSKQARAIHIRPVDDYAQLILKNPWASHQNGVAVRVPSDSVHVPYRIVLLSFSVCAISDDYPDPNNRHSLLGRSIRWLVDRTPPAVEWTYPANGAQVPHSNSAISVELADVGTGVDPDSVELVVNGRRVDAQLRQLLDCLSVIYRPASPFGPGTSVSLSVSCQDRYRVPNRMEPYELSFWIADNASVDDTGPFASDWGPTGLAVSPQEVFAQIKDAGTGVDRGSLIMRVNGRQVAAQAVRQDDGYIIRYAKMGGFGYEKHYEVVVEASDLACPPNEMEPLAFSFFTPKDTAPPRVSEVSPAADSVVDLDEFFTGSRAGRISARVTDEGCGVDRASLRMTVNGRLVDANISKVLNGFSISYRADREEFDYLQRVTVTISASDVCDPPNVMIPTSWSFSFDTDRRPPSVDNTIPDDGQTGVPRNAHIFFVLSEKLDPSSVSPEAIAIDSSGLQVVEGQAFYHPDVPAIEFVPSVLFPSGATVAVTLDASLLDLYGNQMQESFSFEFKTGAKSDFEAPRVLREVDGTSGYESLLINWEPSEDGDAVFYRVYYDSDGCCEPYEGTDASQGPSPITVLRKSELLLTGLQNGLTYYIAVTAMDQCANESEYSFEECVASPIERLDAPTLLSVTAGNAAASLEWDGPDNLYVAGYLVHFQKVGTGGRGLGTEGLTVDAGLTTLYKLTGLTDGQPYSVWVSAYDEASREGEPSEVMTVTPRGDVDWFELRPEGVRPPASYDVAFVLDPPRGRALLFCGVAPESQQDETLWALDLNLAKWSIVPTTGPFPRPGRCFASYDEARDLIWVVDAQISVYQFIPGQDKWVLIETSGEPPESFPACGFFDVPRNRLLFYGRTEWGGNDLKRYTEFYILPLDTFEWQRVKCTGICPTEMVRTAGVYVPDIDRFFLFGGIANDGFSSKLYAMDPKSLAWMRLPAGGRIPMETAEHSMAYDPTFKRLIAFGGRTRVLPHTNSIYEFDIQSGRWSNLGEILTGIAPEPRSYPSLLVVGPGLAGESGYLLVFGGVDYVRTYEDLYCVRLYDFEADTTPPAGVEDLTASRTDDGNSARLEWTAPGDDGCYGRAAGYDLRYSLSAILTDEQFEAATKIPLFYFPSFPGTKEAYVFALPDPNKTYFFALKAFDEAGNLSKLSNSARCEPGIFVPFIGADPRFNSAAPNLQSSRTRTTVDERYTAR